MSQQEHSFCHKCGTPLLPESEFCSKCGTPVPKEAKGKSPVQPASAPDERQPFLNGRKGIYMLVGVVIVSLGLVVGLTTAKSSAPTATPSKTVNPYYSEDYALGARYGQALKNNGDYQNSEINGLCFTLYSRLDEFKYHVDGTLVAEEDFVSGCFTNAVH